MTLKEAHARFQVQGIDESFLGESSGQEEAFQKCLAFLDGVEKTKSIRRYYGSYGLKHKVERAYRGVYVYEGTLVLAALALGYAHEYTDKKHVCCYFNMGRASVDKRSKQLQDIAEVV